MTLPVAPNPISITDVNVEIGRSPAFSTDLNFLKSITKGSTTPFDLGSLRGLTYYQKTNDGNCDNGNCTFNCNCGNIQCTNCYYAGTVNCVNCDAQPLLQANCNCACTYNCAVGPVSYNCDCNCVCDCNCGGG